MKTHDGKLRWKKDLWKHMYGTGDGDFNRASSHDLKLVEVRPRHNQTTL